MQGHCLFLGLHVIGRWVVDVSVATSRYIGGLLMMLDDRKWLFGFRRMVCVNCNRSKSHDPSYHVYRPTIEESTDHFTFTAS